MDRYELLCKLRKEGLGKVGFVKIYQAISYTLLSHFDQKKALDSIMSDLQTFGVCPRCLGLMEEERYGDAAGGMDTRYVCYNCPGEIQMNSNRKPPPPKKGD